MTRRTERVGNLLRNTLAEILLAKMSDPRFNPAVTTITRVEVPEDLLTAKVYVSVKADEKAQRRTVVALKHAAGYLQEQMMKKISLRHTPRLVFVLDEKYQKTMETLSLISEVMDELREKDQAAATDAADESTPETGDAVE